MLRLLWFAFASCHDASRLTPMPARATASTATPSTRGGEINRGMASTTTRTPRTSRVAPLTRADRISARFSPNVRPPAGRRAARCTATSDRPIAAASVSMWPASERRASECATTPTTTSPTMNVKITASVIPSRRRSASGATAPWWCPTCEPCFEVVSAGIATGFASPALDALPNGHTGDHERCERVGPPGPERRVGAQAHQEGHGKVGTDHVLASFAHGCRGAELSTDAPLCRCQEWHGHGGEAGESNARPAHLRTTPPREGPCRVDDDVGSQQEEAHSYQLLGTTLRRRRVAPLTAEAPDDHEACERLDEGVRTEADQRGRRGGDPEGHSQRELDDVPGIGTPGEQPCPRHELGAYAFGQNTVLGACLGILAGMTASKTRCGRGVSHSCSLCSRGRGAGARRQAGAGCGRRRACRRRCGHFSGSERSGPPGVAGGCGSRRFG